MALNKIAIRNAIKAVLLDRTNCGKNVYTSRPTPLWDPELPAVCVSIKSAGFTKVVSSPVAVYDRKLQIEIYVIAKANNDIEDVLDTIESQIEIALSENEYLPSPVTGQDLLKDGLEPVSEEVDVVVEGRIPVGCNVLRYTCSYENEWPLPVDPEKTDEFITANTSFDINHESTVDMENTVTVRSDS